VQLWLVGQAEQAPPFLPHSLVVWALVTQPLVSQHPLLHEFASQATQLPPAQIVPVPHGCPSLMFCSFEHTGPALQLMVPCWHDIPGELPAGLHTENGAQAAQLPWPSHTPLVTLVVAHAVPAAAKVP
jgi:hypothetical protein